MPRIFRRPWAAPATAIGFVALAGIFSAAWLSLFVEREADRGTLALTVISLAAVAVAAVLRIPLAPSGPLPPTPPPPGRPALPAEDCPVVVPFPRNPPLP